MLFLKLITLFTFIFSAGTFFVQRHSKNRFAWLATGLIALASSFFVLKDSYIAVEEWFGFAGAPKKVPEPRANDPQRLSAPNVWPPLFFGLPCPIHQPDPTHTGVLPPIDLSGDWAGMFGVSEGRPEEQLVKIYQNGSYVVAVKSRGGATVPTGAITFCGLYNSNPFEIRLQASGLNYSEPFWITERAMLTVDNKNYFHISNQQTYRRITP
jgi:hypothetical protein